jgi:hypothetical protein
MTERPGIEVVDSATLALNASGRILVAGSHAGLNAAWYAALAGARGVVLNDAGVGKNDAGIFGLELLDDEGVPAAAVDYRSARIGSGEDTYESGVISHTNRRATELGIVAGMRALDAVALLVDSAPKRSGDRQRRSGWSEPLPISVRLGPCRVVLMDSISQVGEEHQNDVIVTGSHGGVVAGRAVKHRVIAAFFNDSGVGRDDAGIGRLAVLDHEDIAGVAIDHQSARIGDARDSYWSGMVSHRNQTAASIGLQPGMAVRAACERIVEHALMTST